MKFSSNWISELAGAPAISPRDLASLITTRTAEQEGVEEAGSWLDRVCAAYPHLTDDDFVAANLDRWLS